MGLPKQKRPGLRDHARWTLWGSLAGLAAVVTHQRQDKLLPSVKRLLAEAAAFQEWLATGAAELREQGHDLWAEARQSAREQVARRLALEQTEAELKLRLEALERAARPDNGVARA